MRMPTMLYDLMKLYQYRLGERVQAALSEMEAEIRIEEREENVLILDSDVATYTIASYIPHEKGCKSDLGNTGLSVVFERYDWCECGRDKKVHDLQEELIAMLEDA